MNVSTKSEYDLRALIYPVGANERGAIHAREIAERWRVPVKYLEQILKSLKEAGIVTSQVSIGGGYWLARPAALIAAVEVIRQLDDRLTLMGCVLDQTTLADLCTQADHQ
jgi:Rrf2 family protein